MAMSSEEARRQAQAEGLMLLAANNKTGYFCVHHQAGRSKPYLAKVWHGGKDVHLGTFATAEEAALCVARSPKGRAAAAERAAAAPPPLTSEEARQQAQAEGLTLIVADNTTGYFGAHLGKPGQPKPYQVQLSRGGKMVSLGRFATAEEAALCVARSPEGQAAARRSAVPPLTSEEARQQAQAEGLMLRVADNKTGYFGVSHRPGKPKPYQARVWRGGKQVSLGYFATAEEAALSVARSPEGQEVAAAVSEEEGKGKKEGAVPPMPLGAYVKDEEVAPPMPPGACFKDEEVAPPISPDAVAKRQHEVVVKEEERSGDRPKRRRSK
eukprot:scaffold81429_cov59-Phaeocystis_antarctica.AAC.4